MGASYRGVARELAGAGDASVFGTERTASADVAALINGGLIHSLEYDDTHTASIVHGSAVVAAAALAVGQASGASGADTLGAYVRGWEIFVRLGLAAPGAFQREGFQITSAGGTMVAALVAADIAGLDQDAAVNAVGIALSQSSGVFEFLTNGSSVKSLHPGWAAHAGVLAARFAQAGMTGPETALEGDRGLFRRFAGSAGAADRFAGMIDDLGVALASARLRLQAAAMLPLSAPVHRRRACAAPARPQVRRCRRADVPDRARRGADRVPSLGGEADPPPAIRCDGACPPSWRPRCMTARSRSIRSKRDLSGGARDLAQRIVWQPLEPNDFPEPLRG